MVAEPIQLSAVRRHGRPSRLHLAELQERNALLVAEVGALHDERRDDVAYIRPYVRRLEVVAHEFGPAAMSSVRAIEARLDRMARRADDPEDAA